MLVVIKKHLPKPLKKFLIEIKSKTIDNYKKRKLVKRMQIKHQKLLADLKGKEKIKVVFLVIHKSVWKVDTVFQRMLSDPFFEPEILVCPYVKYGEEQMLEDMKQAYSYFKDKGYPVTKSLKDNGSWVKLEEIQPDIVFFTNPHNLTRKEYYEDAYLNYLSCYVPYFFMATKHDGDEHKQLNSSFILSLWKAYWAHDYTKKRYNKISYRTDNSFVSGYPAIEGLLKSNIEKNSWKKSKPEKIKIIYAPHHTIEKNKNSLSTFLMMGKAIQSLATRYSDNVHWSFKPHPILKSKLYKHRDWGKERTDLYYKFWEEHSYTQLDEGEYSGLFLESDAIIHDCSSFIIEYAFTNKPSLFLVNENNLKGLLNEFGEAVMQMYEKAKTIEDIEVFINNIINATFKTDKSKHNYFVSYVEKYYKGKLPSERIIEDIKQSLGVISV